MSASGQRLVKSSLVFCYTNLRFSGYTYLFITQFRKQKLLLYMDFLYFLIYKSSFTCMLLLSIHNLQENKLIFSYQCIAVIFAWFMMFIIASYIHNCFISGHIILYLHLVDVWLCLPSFSDILICFLLVIPTSKLFLSNQFIAVMFIIVSSLVISYHTYIWSTSGYVFLHFLIF